MAFEAMSWGGTVKEAVTVSDWWLEANGNHLSLAPNRTLMSILEEKRESTEPKRNNEQICGKS